ncbi:unnamed protein product, partial [Meganyctiphanes norvegica]
WGLLIRMEKSGLTEDKVEAFLDQNSTQHKDLSFTGLIKLKNYLNKDLQRRKFDILDAKFIDVTKTDSRTIRADYLVPCTVKIDPLTFMQHINFTIEMGNYENLASVEGMQITAKKVPLPEENTVTRLTVKITGEKFNATLKNSSSTDYINFKRNFESTITTSLLEHMESVSVILLELREGSLIADADVFTSNTTDHDDVKTVIEKIQSQTGEDIIKFEDPIVKAETFIASGHEAVEPPSRTGLNAVGVDQGTITGFAYQDPNLQIHTGEWSSEYFMHITIPTFCVFFFIIMLWICCCRSTSIYTKQIKYQT